MKRASLVFFFLALGSATWVSCGYSSKSYKGPPSKLINRVLVSQAVNSSITFGGLRMINAKNDTLAFVSEIQAGNTPGLMVLSPTRATLLAFDSATGTVQIVNTLTESNTGSISLPGTPGQPGITTSMVIPATTGIGYAADPVATSNLWTSPGAIIVLNLTGNAITTQIGVPGARTVVSNTNGTQLLVFSSDSDSVSVVSPLIAVPPIDQGCDISGNSVCTVAPGFNRPVSAIFNGNSAYILNCGFECGGSAQASVQLLDMSTNPPTPGAKVEVDGATVAFLQGSTLYVAGNSPTSNDCAGQTTAATTCGRLDVVDLGSMTVTASVVIPDGYHDHLDMSVNGQLFIGSHNCTNIGDVKSPNGQEVRGCLAILNTTATGNMAVIVPPDNGNVTGLQSFSSFNKEYVVQGDNLRVYDTDTDTLVRDSDFIKDGTIHVVGQPVDVKAIDFF